MVMCGSWLGLMELSGKMEVMLVREGKCMVLGIERWKGMRRVLIQKQVLFSVKLPCI